MKSQRPNLRLVQGERSRQAILDAAAKLMATRSYAATSISAIGKACGLPASSIYWHFGSKQGLLAAVIEKSLFEWEKQLPHSDRLIPGKRPNLGERLNNCAKAYKQKPQFLRLMLLFTLERKMDPAALKILRRVHRNIRRQISEMLLAAVDGPLTIEQADDLSDFILSFMQGHFFSFQIDPESADLEKFFEYLHQAVLGLARQFASSNASRTAKSVKRG
jgi:AcrR family transcriptional regulator